MNPVYVAGCAGIALFCLVLGLLESRVRWRVVDTPTVPTGRAFPGRIEVHGRVTNPPGFSLWSPLTGTSCAWWRVDVQKKTGREKNDWKTVASVVSEFPMLVDDGSGAILVELNAEGPRNPAKDILDQHALPNITTAELRNVAAGRPNAEQLLRFPRVSSARPVGVTAALLGQDTGDTFGSTLNLAAARGDWRVIERRIEVGDQLYVHGPAEVAPTNSGAAPLIIRARNKRNQSKQRLLAGLSEVVCFRGTQDEFRQRLAWSSRAPLGGFVAFTGISAAMLFGESTAETLGGGYSVPHGLLAAWIAFWSLALTHGVRARNRVVAAREQVLASWGLVNIATAKRADLIPRLETIVRAAASYERTTLEHLTALRELSAQSAGLTPSTERLVSADAAFHEAQSTLTLLRSLAEASPALRTSANFEQLFTELVNVEDTMATSREYYIHAVTILRDRLQTFPDSWFALFAGQMPPLDVNVFSDQAASSPPSVAERLPASPFAFGIPTRSP